jgi:hypothetical protein
MPASSYPTLPDRLSRDRTGSEQVQRSPDHKDHKVDRTLSPTSQTWRLAAAHRGMGPGQGMACSPLTAVGQQIKPPHGPDPDIDI